MADTKRIIQYGDKRFELDAGMTLDQAKQIMARHFPELADPEIKTEKSGDETVYTFSKKAGRKGAQQSDMAKVRRCLAKLKPRPITIAMIDAALPTSSDAVDSRDRPMGVELELDLYDLPRAVAGIRAALAGLPPAITPEGGMLL